MTRPASPARWLRAALLAGSSVTLALGAHVTAGGHADPVFLVLVLTATTAAAYHWTAKERGLPAIAVAVLAVQLAVHAVLGVGHEHGAGAAMMGAHAVAAVILAVFLRLGEARLHAAARRRLLRWVVALRLALAGRPGVLPRTRPVWFTVVLQSMWVPCVPEGRGPPAFSCLQP